MSVHTRKGRENEAGYWYEYILDNCKWQKPFFKVFWSRWLHQKIYYNYEKEKNSAKGKNDTGYSRKIKTKACETERRV